MVTYVNDLRLSELATGEGSGTWGTTTNTNLELIGEALGYGTEQSFSSDADATTTIGDGVSDPARAMYFKVTSAGSLTATRTLTISPNTVSRVMFIENATSGSQSIAISQGSGANVTIATGKTAVVYLDGAGSGAAVVDAMAGVDPGVTDTLAEVLTAGNTTTTDQKIQFRDTGIYINSSADGQLDIVADTEIQIAATTVDVNGNLDVSGTTVSAGKITADAGIDIDNINIDGTTIALSSGDLTLDVAGDINLDADGADINLKDGGTRFGILYNSASNFHIEASVQDKDIKFLGNDGGSGITALTLDMSDEGAAIFNGHGTFNDTVTINSTSNNALTIAGANGGLNFTGGSNRVYFTSNRALEGATDGSTLTVGEGFTTIRLSNAVVANEAGADADFRVESDSNTHALFVDAGTSRVGINKAAPNRALDVHSGTASDITTFANDAGGYTFGYTANLASWDLGATDALRFRHGSIETLRLKTTESVFNELSSDIDFRVESDSNVNGLYLDAGGNFIAMGNNAKSLVSSYADQHGVGIDIQTGEVQISGDATPLQLGRTTTAGAEGDLLIFRTESNVRGGVSNTSENDLRIRSGSSKLKLGESTDYVMIDTTASNARIELVDNSQANPPTIIGNGPNFLIENGGVERVSIDGSGNTVFNETGVDADFRVESDTNANMFVVDASTNRVGIKNSGPTTTLDMTGVLRLGGTTEGDQGTQLNLYSDLSGNGYIAVYQLAIHTGANSSRTQSLLIDASGNVTIAGSLSKGSGSFKIDHPLPAKTDTHHLVHSFLEAPQADNVYRGKVDLVAGTASVNIDTVAGMTDGTFVLLNREVQCFTSNESGWTAVRGSVSGNTLTITAQDNTCVDTISWLVIGERQDQHMYDTEWTDSNGKVIVEPLKGE